MDMNELSQAQILVDFKTRSDARMNHPGLCAEEYERIVHLVMMYLFNWDIENQKSNGIGIFGKTQAFALATEEQGRKSLHGHFLLFVKGWNQMSYALQLRTSSQQHRAAKMFYENACSARLFSDFEKGMPLSSNPVFSHQPCGVKRKWTELGATPVSDQILREMRHKTKCKEHNGIIATCKNCNRVFSANEIVATALNIHLGKPGKLFCFPETNDNKLLDRTVFEQDKDFTWISQDTYTKALRYFSSNALVNMHLTKHSKRCFKKKEECFADLPDCANESTSIVYNDEWDVFSNWYGRKESRCMFRFQPKRNKEDAFVNTHNPIITSLLGCNNNVLLGMNGRAVIYVTSYNAKSQQKEERCAFEKVSQVLIRNMKNQVQYTE